jgi:polar amino acid transport system ATP-binding protein
VSSRIVFMDAGRILVEGAPGDVLVTPGHDRLRSFLSRLQPGIG